MKVIESYKSDWRPFEPCSENEAIAGYRRAWERMADVMRAFARTYQAAEIRVEPPLHVARMLHGPDVLRRREAKTINGTLRQRAKMANFGRDPMTSAMERGNQIHAHLQQTLHGYKPDLAIVDDWKGYGVPPFEMPGTLDAVPLKSSLLAHGPCDRRLPSLVAPEGRTFNFEDFNGTEIRIHAEFIKWLGGDFLEK